MRLYRALLYVYPASFRAEYGEEMCAIFARRLRETPAIVRPILWVSTLVEILTNAAIVHGDVLRQDLRYAMRTLGRARGFALTAVVVSALGIGATTVAFTMVNHVLLRPFPFAHQEELVNLYEDHSFTAGAGGEEFDIAPANFRDWKLLSTSFQSMAFWHGAMLNLVGEGEPRQVPAAALTYNMLPTLGVHSMIGRTFTADDDREGAPGTAVLSYALWQEAFGGEEGVLGRKILLDNEPFTVIGVMAKDFYFPDRSALLWTPVRFAPSHYEDRTDNWVFGVARLKSGVEIEGARAEMRTIAAQMQRSYPKELARVGITVEKIRDDRRSQAASLLVALFGAAACVLLIACTNLANLLLSRAMMRRKELAVRAALGAGRERLVRQMLTESVVLAIAGGVLGVAIAAASLPLFVRLIPVQLPIAQMPAIDWRVLVFASAVTLSTGIGFGAFPALRASRSRDAGGLQESARSGGGRRERLRAALVIAEVAGSVTLLVVCGLFVRALWRVERTDPGFHAENVLSLRTSLPMPKYQNDAARDRFYERVLDETKQIPGVAGAAYATGLPMTMPGGVWPVDVPDHPEPLSARENACMRFVTPGFFSVMGIRLLAGRDVAQSDTHEALRVAVVSESFVRKYWPGENPLDRRFNFGNTDRRVVGVVNDVRMRGLERSSAPQVYLPYEQFDGDKISPFYVPKALVIRATGDVRALAPVLRRIIHAIDAEQPVSDVLTLSDIVDSQTTPRRVQLTALGSFAAIAFLLAAVGIHGLLSFAVSTRTQEIGVRMALGARAGDIVHMIVRDGLMLSGIGIAIGAGAAYGAGIELRALLAGVDPGDFATFAAAIALCVAMTLGGTAIPAIKAVRIDAATALRTE